MAAAGARHGSCRGQGTDIISKKNLASTIVDATQPWSTTSGRPHVETSGRSRIAEGVEEGQSCIAYMICKMAAPKSCKAVNSVLAKLQRKEEQLGKVVEGKVSDEDAKRYVIEASKTGGSKFVDNEQQLQTIHLQQ